MTTTLRVSSVSFVMGIYGDKSVSRTLLSQIYRLFGFYNFSVAVLSDDNITDLFCIIEKRQYISKTKKDVSKRKMPFFCILKGLLNKQENILCHIHFKFTSKLANYFYS